MRVKSEMEKRHNLENKRKWSKAMAMMFAHWESMTFEEKVAWYDRSSKRNI
jgi:hypothetical protein